MKHTLFEDMTSGGKLLAVSGADNILRGSLVIDASHKSVARPHLMASTPEMRQDPAWAEIIGPAWEWIGLGLSSEYNWSLNIETSRDLVLACTREVRAGRTVIIYCESAYGAWAVLAACVLAMLEKSGDTDPVDGLRAAMGGPEGTTNKCLTLSTQREKIYQILELPVPERHRVEHQATIDFSKE